MHNVSLLFTGDMHPAHDSVAISDSLNDVFNQAQEVIVNLESPITAVHPCLRGKVLLRSPPGQESVVTSFATLVALANNHMMDCGPEGLHETRQRIQQAGAMCFGAGDSLCESLEPIIRDYGEIRVGYLAFASRDTQAHYATASSAGVAPLGKSVVVDAIQNLRTKVNHVIVNAHWGDCDYAYPPNRVVELGETMLDAGATAVIGHHSHVLQGYRQRRDGAIVAYSLGNIYFGEYCHLGRTIQASGESARGAVLNLMLAAEGVTSSDWIFTLQEGSTVRVDHSKSRSIELRQRCEPLHASGYRAYWRATVRRRLLCRAAHWLNPLNWRYLRVATLRGLLTMLKESVAQRNR